MHLVPRKGNKPHSPEIAHALALLDLCIISTFDNLTVIVVDGFYNAWYLGAMFTSS